MYQKDPLTWENVIEVILRDYPTTKKSEDGKMMSNVIHLKNIVEKTA